MESPPAAAGAGGWHVPGGAASAVAAEGDPRRGPVEEALDPPGLEGALVDGEGAVDGLERAVDVHVAVRVAQREGRGERAPGDQLLEEERAEGLARRAVRAERRVGEVAGAADDPEVAPDALALREVADGGGEPRAQALEVLDDGLAPVDAHRRDRRGEPVGLAAVGRREQEDALAVVADAADPHQPPAPAAARHGRARRERPAAGGEGGAA